MKLDDLARTARVDLEESVHGVRVPPPASPNARRAVSVMALLALIAVLVGLAVARNGASEREQGFVDSSAPHYFVLDTDGTSWRPVFVADPRTNVGPVYFMAYFGMAAATDPFAERDAVISMLDLDAMEGLGEPNAVVNGQPAVYRAGVPIAGEGVVANMLMFRRNDRTATVVSRHLDQQAMIKVGEGVRFEGDQIDVAATGLGLERIGSTTRSGDVWSVSYRDAGGDAPAARDAQLVDLGARRGGPDTLTQFRWSGAQPTMVGDRPAVVQRIALSDGAARVQIAWLRADGIVLTLSSTSSEAAARELAGRVREVTEAEWVALQKEVSAVLFGGAQPPANGAAPATSIVTSGPQSIPGNDDGIDWVYMRQGEANWCLTVVVGRNVSSSCMGGRSTEPWATTPWLQRVAAVPVNGRNLSMLTTTDDVATVSLVRPDGARVDYRKLSETLGDGAALFFASAPEVVALPSDAAGSTVQVAVTLRNGTVTTTPVSIPELFRRTP